MQLCTYLYHLSNIVKSGSLMPSSTHKLGGVTMMLSKYVQMNAALEAIFGPVPVEDSSEGLNDECVRNHTKSGGGVGSISP